MSILSPPRDPLLDQALHDAQTWCAGQIIDERAAFVHAVRVTVTIGEHVPDPTMPLVIAALLHDSPEFAPAGLDLDRFLTTSYGPEVPRVVRALQAEHQALDQPDPPIRVDDRPVLLASTADRIVAFTSLLRRAHRSGDTTRFFTARQGLLRLLPHFRACHRAYTGSSRPACPPTSGSSSNSSTTPPKHARDGSRRGDHALPGPVRGRRCQPTHSQPVFSSRRS